MLSIHTNVTSQEKLFSKCLSPNRDKNEATNIPHLQKRKLSPEKIQQYFRPNIAVKDFKQIVHI